MVQLSVHWSDCLENLAHNLFSTATDRGDPFEAECTVVGSPVMAGWLKQYFLYDFPKAEKKQHVLACWDFQMLHPFVNDWVAKASSGTEIGERDPAVHAYSPGALQWRIWKLLCELSDEGKYACLRDYIGDDVKAQDRKRWGLAQRLAQLFDDYQNYRPDLLCKWGEGAETGLDESQSWQAALWHRLQKDEPETYLEQFLKMKPNLAKCGIKDVYRRITVFHVSAMPKAYMQFFTALGSEMPVEMFIFNPSQEFWIEEPTVKQRLKALINNPDDISWMEPAHPLLSGFGRGTQAFLATLLDVTEGHTHSDAWGANRTESLLQKVQADIRTRGYGENLDTTWKRADEDRSIQFHMCHSPMREVEVAKDLILKWFEENADSKPQPRDVQVLVPDMETYAPFIESVFRITDHNPPIPCAISMRPAVSAGTVGAAFVRLMQFNESRMSAPEAIEILELEPVRHRYGLEPDHVSGIRALVNAANIRWGRDQEHIHHVIGVEAENIALPDTVTWRRGLDRLLAGFAIGRCEEGEDMIHLGKLGALRIVDEVEGGTALLVGKLAQFYRDLCETADELATEAGPVSEWTERFRAMVERFFRGTENSFLEIAEIRRGITAVEKAAKPAGDPAVPASIVAAAIEAQLGGMAPAGRSDTNAALFGPLNTMQVTPRKLIIMLGLNEGAFPRADQRPAFDLLASKPRYGDRSLRYEDRLAFLEAIMSARDRLIITYTGRNITNNKAMPPSPAVTEFLQYLRARAQDKDNCSIRPVEHKLHGFNPAYFQDCDSELFSYSRSNHAAARILVEQNKGAMPPTSAAPSDAASPAAASPEERAKGSSEVTLDDLQRFFENPARFFYTNILQIRLLDPARDDVQDSEMFDVDSLDNYRLNEALIRYILARPTEAGKVGCETEEQYFKALQERSLIPLGPFGRGKTRQQISDIEEFLKEPLRERQASVGESLRADASAHSDPARMRVECGSYTITAELPLQKVATAEPASPFLLCFRYAKIKPKDCLRAWLAHLVGHAAGESFETLIAGHDKGSLELVVLPPMQKEGAEETLARIVTLYEAGHDAVLPFAPSSSYAFAKKIESARDADEADKEQNEAAAYEEAYKEWNDGNYPECNDRYLSAEWHEDGPMVLKDFKYCATTFWESFFRIQAEAQSESERETIPAEDEA